MSGAEHTIEISPTSTPFDVAIVGYGPAGALLANLLGQAGLQVVVVEREAEIYPLPRAIHFDGEVMRIFQSVGLRPQVEAISRPGRSGMQFVNAHHETLLTRGGSALLGPHGCANNYYFHQPELEALLRQGVRRFGNVQVMLAQEVTGVAECGDQVTLHLRDLRDSRQPTPSAGSKPQDTPPNCVHARYVIGCDGARSLVRKTIGAVQRDLGLHQPWLVFDVILNEDQVDLPQLPDHTVQHCDPARPMTYCNVNGRRRRWEIMILPGDDEASLLRHDKLWQLIARWLKPNQAVIERATVYTFHSTIAQGWRGGAQGRLLLAGDSCHQAPPFLGQGMCAGLRDVANLAWKLALVTQGQAAPALLDTYESERAPHVAAFVALAVRLGNIIQTTDPLQAAQRDQKFLAGSPEIFNFPSPGLGPGMVMPRADAPLHTPAHTGPANPTGQCFPQPQLANGQWLDELVGNRFLVLALPEILSSATTESRAIWQAVNAAVLAATDPALCGWLDLHGVKAAIIRPDRYILGVARDGAELETMNHCLSQHLLRPFA